MSNKEDLESCKTAIEDIPQNEVKTPTMPVDIYLQEAEDLYHWAGDDQAKLATVGITIEQITEIPVRAGACREAQSLWIKESRSQDEWNEKAPIAYALRDELLHNFRYAFRNKSSLISRVNEIDEGTGHDDMVQDLNDLAVLGQKNTSELEAIGFDLTKLDTAATLSDEMADLLAITNGNKTGGTDSKFLRDQAYTYLKSLVDEIREAGKFLFWKDERRLKGYASNYWRKQNASKTGTQDPSAN